MGGCASSKTTDDRDEKTIKTTKSNALNQTKFSNITNDKGGYNKNEYLINNNAIKSPKIKQKARRGRKEIIRRPNSRNLQCG